MRPWGNGGAAVRLCRFLGAETAVVRRRFFRAGGSTQSRTEVVADKVIPVRRAKAAERAVAEALAAAEELWFGSAA